MPHWSEEKIKFKWFSIQKSIEQKISWSPDEDKKLSEIIEERQKNGIPIEKLFKWTEIAVALNNATSKPDNIRLGKHCRERWFNHLDPSFKKSNFFNPSSLKNKKRRMD